MRGKIRKAERISIFFSYCCYNFPIFVKYTHIHTTNLNVSHTHTLRRTIWDIFPVFNFYFFVLAYTNTFSKIHRYTHMYRFKIFLLLRNNFHFGGIFRRKKIIFSVVWEFSPDDTIISFLLHTHTLSHAPLAYKFTYIKKDLRRRRLILFGYFSLSNFAFTEDNLTTQIP